MTWKPQSNGVGQHPIAKDTHNAIPFQLLKINIIYATIILSIAIRIVLQHPRWTANGRQILLRRRTRGRLFIRNDAIRDL
jgi:hypothetical protein